MYHSRIVETGYDWQGQQAHIEQLMSLAIGGLPRFYSDGKFVRTVRRVRIGSEFIIRPEGDDLRYAAIVALGLATLNAASQLACLSGSTAASLSYDVAARAAKSDEIGAVALGAWAAAEAGNRYEPILFEKLAAALSQQKAISTVACAWALSAALAAKQQGDAKFVGAAAAARLMAAQGPKGLFPHMLPVTALGRTRAHVSCFADQVYPIQALARYAAATRDQAALQAASQCATRICELQGPHGQWWWHYDVRNGNVVEGYPVYSVHQHAMAPMALLELREAGGPDLRQAVSKGVAWLYARPESSDELVSEAEAIVWRKIGRREPPKFVRSVSAVTTSLIPDFRLPGLNAFFPPAEVDYECRPYEFGWLIYAWLSGGVVSALTAKVEGAHV